VNSRLDAIAHDKFRSRLDRLAVHLHMTRTAQLCGVGACLGDSNRPQPLVNARRRVAGLRAVFDGHNPNSIQRGPRSNTPPSSRFVPPSITFHRLASLPICGKIIPLIR
jgi:hypothetical protein